MRYPAKGQVRLRVASVATTGGPADDDLLPAPLLLTEAQLQALTEPLLLTWPTAHILVPGIGAFLVLEGIGDAPDEYVVSAPHLVVAGPGYCQVGRRSQPEAALRTLNLSSIPELLGAKPSGSLDLWVRGGDYIEWQALPGSKRVPLVEVGFR